MEDIKNFEPRDKRNNFPGRITEVGYMKAIGPGMAIGGAIRPPSGAVQPEGPRRKYSPEKVASIERKLPPDARDVIPDSEIE